MNEFISYLDIPVPELPESLIPLTKPDKGVFPKRQDYSGYRLIDRLQRTAALIRPEIIDAKLGVTNTTPEIAADYTLGCHSLAKILKKSPQEIAEEIAAGFEGLKPPEIQGVETQNGYLNFVVDTANFGNQVISDIERMQGRYGNINLGEGEGVIIDCSSPNVAKFMSVGHLRSTIIGESLTRLYRATGYTVVRDNHLGDWGTQFGMLGRAHELWADEYPELKNPTTEVQGLYKLYVRIHDESEKEKHSEAERLGITDLRKIEKIETSLEKEGRKWFQELEAGNLEALELLKWATEKSMPEFQRVYDKLKTSYEYILGESFFIGMLPDVVQFLVERGIAQPEDDGALAVNLKAQKLGKLIVQKRDGTSLYSTRDLATLVARTAWFNPRKIIYVVGGDQREYFQQLFATWGLMTDGGKTPEVEHVSFGLIKLPEGKMSTRRGRVVFLEDVLDEAVSRAKEKTDQSSGNLSEEERDDIARQVGIGAVVFSDLGQGRDRNIVFDYDKALSFEGYSAGYIQYAHARVSSLLRRAQDASVQISTDIPVTFTNSSEQALVMHLSRFPDSVVRAQEKNSPSSVAEFIFRTAELFNNYYRQSSIFNEADENIRNGRLRLARACAQVIENGLNLLCIEAPERM